MDRNAEAVPAMTKQAVALRKESVDRNLTLTVRNVSIDSSLSARRAWIEIAVSLNYKEVLYSRSPQGERG